MNGKTISEKYTEDVSTYANMIRNHSIDLNDEESEYIDSLLNHNAILDGRLFLSPFVILDTPDHRVEFDVRELLGISIQKTENVLDLKFRDNKFDISLGFKTERLVEAVALFIRLKWHLFTCVSLVTRPIGPHDQSFDTCV